MEPSANIYRSGNSYRVLLSVAAAKIINSDEICFDKKNLVIRIPTIYDNRTHKLYKKNVNNAAFVFTCDQELDMDITGKYKIEKEDDDYYFVKK